MTVVNDPHPSVELLAQYNLGKLDDPPTAQVEGHVATCETCARTLANLPGDTLIAMLQRQPETKADETQFSDLAPPPIPPAQQQTLPPTAEQGTLPPGVGSTRFTEDSAGACMGLPPALANHGRYQILERLGEGGMGSVYKAQHRMMNRPVALKIINPQLINHPGAVERFHREVQAAARLSHPNIVAAHDAEQAGNLHFLVMEFVDGIDLHQVVQERGPLPVAEACDYIRQAALGLQHAHERGMVHRDIKPHNLMLVQSGTQKAESGIEATSTSSSLHSPPSALVKILDFGLANLASEAAEEAVHQGETQGVGATSPQLTLMGSMMGTPDYIAPEQAIDAHAVDIRADIYSLGCTLYCLLTGRAPFQEGTVYDKIVAHAEKAAAPLSAFRADVPAEVEHILERMMAKNPADRYQTPAEVAEALAKYIAFATRPETLVAKKAGIPPRRLFALAATALLGLFALAAAAIVVVTDRGRLEIQSEVDDVQVVVKQNGQEVRLIDLKTGSQVNWLPSGDYELELVGGDNEVTLDKRGLVMSRLGKVIVTARYAGNERGVIRSFNTSDQPITRNGVEVVNGGWKLTADKTQTVRLFEIPDPTLKPGRFFYRAKLKTENVKGRAYLEMWVRIPGMGESFSKGFHNALSGDNGWAEYEIPFLLLKGQHPDLVKLNVTIEGGGTVWIKDIELRGRTDAGSSSGSGGSPPTKEITEVRRF